MSAAPIRDDFALSRATDGVRSGRERGDLDTAALSSALERILRERGVTLPVVVERVQQIARTPLGKAPLIKRAEHSTRAQTS